jgi:amino acid transporter
VAPLYFCSSIPIAIRRMQLILISFAFDFEYRFDLAGTCASEVKNPSRSYPRALKFTLILIISAYAFPALVGISLFPDHTNWKFDTYSSIAKIVGGGFLEVGESMPHCNSIPSNYTFIKGSRKKKLK